MSALDFVAKYEEPKVASLFGRRYKTGINKWLFPKTDTFRQDTKSMIGALTKGK